MTRSLTFYSFNDDPTMRNYMALVACILNPKLTYSRAMNIFEINCEGDKRNSLNGGNQEEDKPKSHV